MNHIQLLILNKITMEQTQSDSQTGLLLISKLYAEGRIDDEDRDKLKGNHLRAYLLINF